MKTLKDAKTYDELLDIKYGEVGTPRRDIFEASGLGFVTSEMVDHILFNQKPLKEQSTSEILHSLLTSYYKLLTTTDFEKDTKNLSDALYEIKERLDNNKNPAL